MAAEVVEEARAAPRGVVFAVVGDGDQPAAVDGVRGDGAEGDVEVGGLGVGVDRVPEVERAAVGLDVLEGGEGVGVTGD